MNLERCCRSVLRVFGGLGAGRWSEKVTRLTNIGFGWLLLFLTFSGLLLSPTDGHARRNEVSNWPLEDFDIYPPYCRARILREPKELEMYWTARLGVKNFIHMHHYCHGLRALTLAYSSFNDRQRRTVMANAVVGNLEYIIRHTEPNFVLRGEALMNLARGHVLLQEYDVARKRFEEALRFDPNLVDAWVAMSDMYYQVGKKGDALTILEQARETVGENKKIDLRIAEMRAAGVKSSTADGVRLKNLRPPPAAPAPEAQPTPGSAAAPDPSGDPAPAEAPAPAAVE